jgi:type IV pilus assembly protein PilC
LRCAGSTPRRSAWVRIWGDMLYMAKYRYRGSDTEGNALEGDMEAASYQAAMRTLRERGMEVNALEEIRKQRPLQRSSRPLSYADLHLFASELQGVASSGLAMAPAIRGMASDIRKPRLRNALEQLGQDLESGMELDEALKGQRGAFPLIFIYMVRAGQASGNLSGVLQLLCGYTNRMLDMRNMLWSSLANPAVTLLLATVIIFYLLYHVVPIFGGVFLEFNAELPGPTAFLLDVSTFVRQNARNLCAGGIGAVCVVVLTLSALRRSSPARRVLDQCYLHVPLLGYLHYLVSLARFSRTLAVLLQSGAPIMESIDLAAAASGSATLRNAANGAVKRVLAGESLAAAFRSNKHFGHRFCWLVGAGEARGDVETALLTLAETYEREAALREQVLSSTLEPIFILALGAIIGFIVTAIYLPIFTLADAIGGP